MRLSSWDDESAKLDEWKREERENRIKKKMAITGCSDDTRKEGGKQKEKKNTTATIIQDRRDVKGQRKRKKRKRKLQSRRCNYCRHKDKG